MRIIGDEAGAMREHAGIARISYYYRRNRVGHTAGPRAWRGRRARVVQAELRKKHVRAVRSRCVCIILLVVSVWVKTRKEARIRGVSQRS